MSEAGQALPQARTARHSAWARSPDLPLAAIAAVLIAGLAFVFVRPFTLIENYISDTFVIFDSMHRLSSGQMPSTDFATPLGAATYVLPWLAYRGSGHYAGSIETASVWLAAALLLASVYILRRRVGLWAGAVFLLAVAGVTAVPLVQGEAYTLGSPGMPYNRWGWSALAVLMTLGVPSLGHRNSVLVEAGIAALLLTFLFYLKVSYFGFGVLYMALLAFCRDERRSVGVLALLAGGVLSLAIGLGSGMLGPYLRDILDSRDASGGAVRAVEGPVFLNVRDLMLTGLACALIAAVARLRRLEWILVGFIVLSGVVILGQNWHRTGIFTLLVVFLFADRAFREAGAAAQMGRWTSLGLMAILATEDGKEQFVATARHLKTSLAPGAMAVDLPNLEGFTVGERKVDALRMRRRKTH